MHTGIIIYVYIYAYKIRINKCIHAWRRHGRLPTYTCMHMYMHIHKYAFEKKTWEHTYGDMGMSVALPTSSAVALWEGHTDQNAWEKKAYLVQSFFYKLLLHITQKKKRGFLFVLVYYAEATTRHHGKDCCSYHGVPERSEECYLVLGGVARLLVELREVLARQLRAGTLPPCIRGILAFLVQTNG